MIKTRIKKPLVWFSFFDLATGGYEKTEYQIFFIEAQTEEEAIHLFEEETGMYPFIKDSMNNEYFAMSKKETLEGITEYWFKNSNKATIKEYLEEPHVLAIKLE